MSDKFDPITALAVKHMDEVSDRIHALSVSRRLKVDSITLGYVDYPRRPVLTVSVPGRGDQEFPISDSTISVHSAVQSVERYLETREKQWAEEDAAIPPLSAAYGQVNPGAVIREEVLDAAKACVLRDRNATHGRPEDNFQNIADLWNLHLRQRGLLVPGAALTSVDVALLCVDIKRARLLTSPDNKDNWVDAVGYLACGAGIALNRARPTETSE